MQTWQRIHVRNGRGIVRKQKFQRGTLPPDPAVGVVKSLYRSKAARNAHQKIVGWKRVSVQVPPHLADATTKGLSAREGT